MYLVKGPKASIE